MIAVPAARLPVAILFFCIIIGPLSLGGVEPWGVAMLQLALLLFGMASVFFGYQTTNLRTFWPATAGIGVCVIGVLQSLSPNAVNQPGLSVFLPMTASRNATESSILFCFCIVVLMLYCSSVLSRRSIRWGLVIIILTIGFLVAVIGIIQKAHGNMVYGILPIRSGRAPFGPYSNSDHASSLMAMSLLAGCGLFIEGFRNWRTTDGIGKIADILAKQFLVMLILAVIVFGLKIAWSRGAILSIGIASICTACFATMRIASPITKHLGRLLLLICVVLAAVIVYKFPEILGMQDWRQDPSTLFRLNVYRDAFELLRDYPVWGTGLGALKCAFQPYKTPIQPYDFIVDQIHNDWLQLAVETGAVGAFICGCAAVGFFVRYMRWYCSNSSSESRTLMGGMMAAAMCFLCHAVVDFNSHIPANVIVFIVIVCWLEAGMVGTRESQPEPEKLRCDALARWAIASILMIMIIPAIRPAVAWAYARKAEHANLAAQPYYYSKAIEYSDEPRYKYALGAVYLKIGENNPAAMPVSLLQAMHPSETALKMEYWKYDYRYLMGAILWRMDRIDDAQEYIDGR